MISENVHGTDATVTVTFCCVIDHGGQAMFRIPKPEEQYQDPPQILLWTELCLPPQSSYVEVLTPNVIVFGNSTFRELINVK